MVSNGYRIEHHHGTGSRTNKPVVFGMRADPYPCDRIRVQCANSAIVVSNANGETILSALQPAEVERG
jgi:hypothetical protein